MTSPLAAIYDWRGSKSISQLSRQLFYSSLAMSLIYCSLNNENNGSIVFTLSPRKFIIHDEHILMTSPLAAILEWLINNKRLANVCTSD